MSAWHELPVLWKGLYILFHLVLRLCCCLTKATSIGKSQVGLAGCKAAHIRWPGRRQGSTYLSKWVWHPMLSSPKLISANPLGLCGFHVFFSTRSQLTSIVAAHLDEMGCTPLVTEARCLICTLYYLPFVPGSHRRAIPAGNPWGMVQQLQADGDPLSPDLCFQ